MIQRIEVQAGLSRRIFRSSGGTYAGSVTGLSSPAFMVQREEHRRVTRAGSAFPHGTPYRDGGSNETAILAELPARPAPD
jgi:hypothetical protein